MGLCCRGILDSLAKPCSFHVLLATPASSSISLTWKLVWETLLSTVEERFLPWHRETLHRLTRKQGILLKQTLERAVQK